MHRKIRKSQPAAYHKLSEKSRQPLFTFHNNLPFIYYNNVLRKKLLQYNYIHILRRSPLLLIPAVFVSGFTYTACLYPLFPKGCFSFSGVFIIKFSPVISGKISVFFYLRYKNNKKSLFNNKKHCFSFYLDVLSAM